MMMGFSRFMSCCILAITITNVVSFQRSLNGMRHRGRQSLNVAMNAEHSGLAMTDKVSITKFHHVEFYCGDATNTYKRFLVGLGMELISKSDQSTGNCVHASYVLKSGDMQMVFTAPYSSTMGTSPTTPSATATATAPAVSANLDNIVGPFPSFHPEVASDFFKKHGFGVKSVAVEVSDVTTSYDAMMMSGGISYLKPTKVTGR